MFNCLCKNSNKEDYLDVTNLWIKKNGKVIKKSNLNLGASIGLLLSSI